ncbi:MAG: polyprenyl synthetase family protein, partial [Candidatus Puniceispirillaceae bacterium]
MAGTPLILQQDAEQTSVWLEHYFNRLNSAKAPHLLAAMRYSAMNGGKRVRASLVLSAARLASGNTGAPLPAHLAVAGAVEMLHAYSLIHDDLPAMDDADLRRGVAACHKAF